MSADYAACSCEQSEALKARVRELESLLEAAAAELDRRDEHLAHLRGTVPGDQGGRVKGDGIESCRLCGHRRGLHLDGERCWHADCDCDAYGTAEAATQGAAVAGPAPLRCRQCGGVAEEERRCYATPVCFACLPPPKPLPVTPWPAPLPNADLTAAKAALEAARDNAVRERDEARADRTRALALATEHLAAKAALEVQLRDERAAHEATKATLPDIAAHSHGMGQEDARQGAKDESDMWRDMYRDVASERDALAAQLKAAREVGQRVVDALELHERQRDTYRAACSPGSADRFNRAVQLAQEARVCLDVARAALAASGPVKEGT